jgi:hypothetical protein
MALPKNKLTRFLSYFATYMAIYGTVGFGLFILEESIQNLQFGGWQLEKAQDYHEILVNSDLMEKTNNTMLFINKWFGWMNPIGYIAYRDYGTATDRYVMALRHTVFANAPDLMAGRRITIRLRYERIEPASNGGFDVVAGPVHIPVNTFPDIPVVEKTGIVRIIDKAAGTVTIR